MKNSQASSLLMSLRVMQAEVRMWTDKNFGDARGLDAVVNPTLGVSEEVGELCHSILKLRQQIRGNEKHLDKAQDAIGDTTIYLLDICNRMGWDLETILVNTWEEVKKRDWRNNPDNNLDFIVLDDE